MRKFKLKLLWIEKDLIFGAVAIIAFVLVIGIAVAQTTTDDFKNTFTEAHSIAVDAEGGATQAGVINSPTDVDMFTFTSAFDGWVKVHQEPTTGSPLNCALSVFGANQIRITRDDGPNLVAEFTFAVKKNESYYLRAASNAGTTGAYQLQIERGQPLGQKPNLILVYTDDQTYTSLAAMPFMSQRKDWYIFDKAFINNPVCCPSRATVLTGLWSHHTGVEATGGAPIFDDTSTLATWLNNAGYRTGMFGKYHLGSVDETAKTNETFIPPGWDEWYSWRGLTASNTYYDYTLNENGTLVEYGSNPEDYSTDVLANKVIDFIKESDGVEPFFIYFTPRAPHNPWTPAPRHIGTIPRDTVYPKSENYNEVDMSDKPIWWQTLPLVTDQNSDGARRKENETLLAVDEAMMKIWRTLNEKKMLRNTVIVYMSDNGYSYGEHRWGGKLCPYEECIHVPLLVWYPKGTPRTISRIVSNADIAPTFAALAGIEPGSVDGNSLLDVLGGDNSNWRNYTLIRSVEGPVPEYWGIRTDRYKYIEIVPTGEVELYDLKIDPAEVQNVANKPEYAATQADLDRKLDQLKALQPR